MLDIFNRLLDCLLPPHPLVLQIRKEKPEHFLRFFSLQKYENCVYLSDYSSNLINSAIKANKFHNDTHASKLLATLLNKWLKSLPEKPTILVPIPLTKNHERDRGYNQVLRILQNLDMNEQNLILNLLSKTRDTVSQTKLNRQQRLHNLDDAFAFIKPDMDIKSYRIILVDDVTTTGATIKSAHKILKNSLKNHEIICVAIAH